MPDYSDSVQWLLHSRDPSIRYLALTEILLKDPGSREAVEGREQIARGDKVKKLLENQNADGGFGKNPYRKWTGAHWRLVSLVNLAVPEDNPHVLNMAEHVLDWIYGRGVRGQFPVKNNRARMHASVYGNPIGSCSYLGLGSDHRVKFLVELLMKNQWPDGGWNCDPKPEAAHSSFHETLATLWGLVMYYRKTGDSEVKDSIENACELFLSHHIFRSHRSGSVIKKEFLKLRYPVYWHYNFLEAMRVLALAGKARDERMTESLNLLEEKCDAEGRWKVEGTYWSPFSPDQTRMGSVDIVDWGRSGPNEMITLNALRVLRAAGRFRS